MNPDYMKGWRHGREDAYNGVGRPDQQTSPWRNSTYWLGYFDGYDEAIANGRS